MNSNINCVQFGILNGGGYAKMFESDRRVYSSESISPTITTVSGGHKELKISEEKDVSGADRTGGHGSTDRHSWDLACEPMICASRGRNPENPSDRTVGVETQQRIEINENGTSNTITSFQKDNMVAERYLYSVETEQGVSIHRRTENGDYGIQGKRAAKENQIGDTITTSRSGNVITASNSEKKGTVTINGKTYRIRKLTPRECWRLMDYSDEDFDKAAAMGTASQHLYKQAGNGIVVACLEGIYDKLFVHTDLTEPKQLTLF